MQNCIHGAKQIRICGMEVCKLYDKYFPVNRISMKILIQAYLKKISVKQFKIRNDLGDWKSTVY